jgi:hypothetical protein
VSELIAIERAALHRCLACSTAIALGLFAAEVGGLALYSAVARMRAVFSHGTIDQLGTSFGALLLGADLAFVLMSMGLGLGATALARPLVGRALAMPAARTSAGIVALYAVVFCVAYATGLGLMELVPALLARVHGWLTQGVVLSLALMPPVGVLIVLLAGALAASALVARGVPPGRSLTSGLDHVLRRPRSLALFAAHAMLAALLIGLAQRCGAISLVITPPVVVLTFLLGLAAFDTAMARDARLSTG